MQKHNCTNRLLRVLTLKRAVGLFMFISPIILAGCTISFGPLANDDSSAQIRALEDRLSKLEAVQVAESNGNPPSPSVADKNILAISGLDGDGQPTSSQLEVDKLLFFTGLNETSYQTLTNTFNDNTRLEYALLFTGVENSWRLYHTQALTKIITVTQIAAYMESQSAGATIGLGPRFTVSSTTWITDASPEIAWWKSMNKIGEREKTLVGEPPSGMIFRHPTALIVMSDGDKETPNITLIGFWGVQPTGKQSAPGGPGDLQAACQNCTTDCSFWCFLVR